MKKPDRKLRGVQVATDEQDLADDLVGSRGKCCCSAGRPPG